MWTDVGPVVCILLCAFAPVEARPGFQLGPWPRTIQTKVAAAAFVDAHFSACSLPACGAFDSGIKGCVATINVKPGTKVGLVLEAYDPDTDKPVEIPHGSLTFFDVDEGPGDTGREYVLAHGFQTFYVANATEVFVMENSDGSKTFLGTCPSIGTDNPASSWILQPHQKQKAVTLEFKQVKELRFTLGATDGSWPRYFEFAATPSVVCAQTVLNDITELLTTCVQYTRSFFMLSSFAPGLS